MSDEDEAINYNALSGPQMAVLRRTLEACYSRDAFDLQLEDAGLPGLDSLAKNAGFGIQLGLALRELKKRARLGVLVAVVRDGDYAQNDELQALDARLRFVAPVEAAVVVARGMTLERAVRESGLADPFLWASRLTGFAQSMCRISYPVGAGTINGTGILVSPGKVLTNFHVIEPIVQGRAQAQAVICTFGYAEQATGLSVGVQLGLADPWLAKSSPYSAFDLGTSDQLPGANALDFALLSLEKADTDMVPVDLNQLGARPDEGEIILILQHPSGKPLQQSWGVVLKSPAPSRLRYDADTFSGSSGGLVLNMQLEPVALHHAGDPNFKQMAQFNQGIGLDLIRAEIRVGTDA